MRRAALGLGALLLLAGCGAGDGGDGQGGGDGGGSGATAAPSASSGGTQLTVVLDLDGSGDTVTSTLTCDPPAGDVADPAAACAQVDAVGPAGFATPDPGAVCTQQYDGPQTADVSGTVAGQPVRATFTRTDGCAISRWDALSALLPTAR
ncbi:Subtilisin inhibitor-like [Klenkia marina]|uniref:Subtilisin inhibitor-like n=1 Tax=Klenkia marina TaxID=1960309 RepID=A0A1G4XXB9_9ACTN|nr:SSI family serine proteinase inhibitor [Klenkia marina]SCX45793.1 Subtilisin inhibitor-like [Klenkia marina]